MKKIMVSKKIIAKAIARNAVLFNRKIEDKDLSVYVENYHEFLPLMTDEEFSRVDRQVVSSEKFFPTLADYTRVHTELIGAGRWY